MDKIEIIKGTYSPEEAKEILFNIINSKLDFHNMKNVSSQIRYNQPEASSEKRIEELNNSFKKIQQVIAKAAEDNQNLTIHSSIELTLSSSKADNIA
ncbi:hypothetical protein C9994_02460 [Marivirga lumbricoides]|uniref:Uncharacterized protein n=1 Tax=Marivirga lumbricoides TaxID=1046115 RepID=A0A2T4DUR6_9BACT|nr:hypothetical protein C9994_02460 [Marivirga lumbricoides]